MGGSRGLEWLRARSDQLHEAAHGGPHQLLTLTGHARRLVRGVRAGAEPQGGVCLACFAVHTRGVGRAASHRISLSSANYLEQRTSRPDSNALLVPARTLLVCAEKACALVRRG